MNADLSRQTFNALKRYISVIEQQGRVLLDAEWNEQEAIQRHHDENVATDVIGHTGFPRVNPGFEIAPTGDSASLTISPGHGYVEGILVENEATVDIGDQPDLPADIATLPDQGGRYLIYLDVWRRLITYLDDPDIREVAVGVDTTARLKTVWQVKWLAVGSTDTCETFGEGWQPQADPTGTLAVQTVEPPTSTDPCALPPAAGYRRLENQLYRVEVHRGGAFGDATFKWSRENGSVSTAILDVSGQVLTVESTGKDDYLGFHPLDWVEIVSDATELGALPDPNNAGQFLDQHGYLVQIEDVDPNLRQITISASTPLPALNPADLERLHTKLRRWDQRGTTATVDGVALASGWIDLEDGIQVQFDDTAGATYRAGDYWMIPARTATDATSGGIEWEFDESTNPATPIPLLPFGVVHAYAPLAVVDFSPNSGFSLPADADCRPIFPPLTAITADDVSFDNTICNLPDGTTVQEALEALCQRTGGGTCTLTATPGPGWESIFDQIPQGGSAEVCFPAGDYIVEAPVIVPAKGFLKITGAGVATRLMSGGDTESVLVFDNCSGVLVRDIFTSSDFVQEGDPDEEGLNGTIMFRNCGMVELESVIAQCGHGTIRATSCINVINHDTEFSDLFGSPARGLVRIHGCRLLVGHAQIGAMVINGARTQIEDNVIEVREQKPGDLNATLERLRDDIDLRAEVRRILINDIETEWQGEQGGNRVRMPINDFDMNFRVHPWLIEMGLWDMLREIMPPEDVNSTSEAREYLLDTANALLADPAIIDFFPGWLVQEVLQQDTSAMYQGIVVAGQESHEMRILNNTIIMAAQGIHIGLSHSGEEEPLRAQDVQVMGNTVYSVRPPSLTREAHGIYLGNFRSATISNNRVRCNTLTSTEHLPNFGITVIGYFGQRLIMRDNEARGYTTGIYASSLSAFNPDRPGLWVVRENLATVDLNPANAFIQENNFPPS